MKGSPLKAQTYIDQSRDVFIDQDLFELGYSGYDLVQSPKRRGCCVGESGSVLRFYGMVSFTPTC